MNADLFHELIGIAIDDETLSRAQLGALTTVAALLSQREELALEWGRILTERTAPPLAETSLTERIYTLWAKVPPEDRNYSGWVMSQATLNEIGDEIGGRPVPLPAALLGRPVRIDPNMQGIKIEQRRLSWGSATPAWVWP